MRDDRSVKTRKTNDFSKIIRHVISQARKGSQKHIAIVAGVVLLLVLIVAGAIWGITSMVGGNDAEPDPEDKIEVKIDPEADNKYNKDEAAIDTAKLSKTVLPQTAAADKTYIDETVFIGDSNTVRTMMYGYTTWNNVVGATSMGIQHVTSKPVTFFAGMADPVDVPTSIKILQPKRVIVTYGTNNTLGWSEKKFIEEYSKALKAIAGAYPYTDIIVNAIPPIDKQRENLAITMQTIDGFNKALSEMCDKHGYKFLNSAEALKDEKTGFAKTDFTIGDGVHLSQKGMDALFDYIKTHAYITEDKRPKLTYIPKRLETPTGIIGGDPIAVRGAKVSVSFVSNDYELGSIEGEAEQRLKRTETTQGVSAKAKTENGGVFVGWTAECEGVSNKSSADITFTVPQLAEGVTEVKIVANFRKIGLSISQTSASIEKNHTLNLTANIEGGDFEGDKTVTWSSTNPGVASVDANGRVTGVGNGQATIKASVLGGKITATCNVNVSVKLQSISIKAEGDKKEMSTKSTLKLSVVASPDGAPMSGATWSSSDPSIAEVSTAGVVTSKDKEGSVTITAKIGGLSDPYVIKVVAPIAPKPITGITLNPPSATISSGGTVQLTGAVAPADTTFDKSVTFSSSNDGVATVSGTGLVTAKTVSAQTTVTITCRSVANSEKYATVIITITPAPKPSPSTPPVDPSIPPVDPSKPPVDPSKPPVDPPVVPPSPSTSPPAPPVDPPVVPDPPIVPPSPPVDPPSPPAP